MCFCDVEIFVRRARFGEKRKVDADGLKKILICYLFNGRELIGFDTGFRIGICEKKLFAWFDMKCVILS